MFQGDQEHHGKLEAFGGMERHERDFVLVRFQGVGVGHERGLFKERLERCWAGIRQVELAGRRDQFVDVRHAFGIFRVRRPFEFRPIARGFDHLGQELLDRSCGRLAQPIEKRDKPRDAQGCSTGQAQGGSATTGRLQQRQSVRGGEIGQFVDGGLADAADRRVDDAQQGGVVRRIVDQVQVGQQILDLFALEELQPLDDLVRHAVLVQRQFELAGQSVHTIRDREIPWPPPLGADVGGDPPRDQVRLVVRGRAAGQPHRSPLRPLGKQHFRLASSVVPNQRVGRFQNVRGAAIVPFKLHDFDPRIVVLELQNVRQVRAAPTVNRLVGIADDRQVRVVDRQSTDNRVLREVRILVLVNHDLAEAVIERAAQIGLVAQHQRHVHQQVIEIDTVGGQQPPLVQRIDPLDDRFPNAGAGLRVMGGVDELVFRPADRLPQFVNRHHRVFDPGLRHRRAKHLSAVVDVEYRIVFLKAGEACVLPEQSRAETMEGSDPDGRVGAKFHEAVPHLLGRFVRESQREDLPGQSPQFQQMGDAVRDHPRFSAAGTGEYQQRSFDMFGRRTLLGVERIE